MMILGYGNMKDLDLMTCGKQYVLRQFMKTLTRTQMFAKSLVLSQIRAPNGKIIYQYSKLFFEK